MIRLAFIHTPHNWFHFEICIGRLILNFYHSDHIFNSIKAHINGIKWFHHPMQAMYTQFIGMRLQSNMNRSIIDFFIFAFSIGIGWDRNRRIEKFIAFYFDWLKDDQYLKSMPGHNEEQEIPKEMIN